MRSFQFRLCVALQLVLISGCANWIPADARMRMNANASTYDLCDRLAVGTLAPRDVRSEWEMELGRRGASCNSYADDRRKQDVQDRAALNRALTSLSRSMAAQARDEDDLMDSKPGFRSGGATCFKQGESVRNTSRHCVYNCAGSEVIQTVSVVELCPVSLTR